VVDRRGSLDHVTVEVEAANAMNPEACTALSTEVRHHIKSMIGISADVSIRNPGEIPRSMGKAVRVRDLRPKQP
jgi:phenylacetate-CoA ligase